MAETDIAPLLREIFDNRREALALQRDHIAMDQRQPDRVERCNDRAEAIRGRAGTAVQADPAGRGATDAVLPGLALMPYPFR